MEFLKEERFIGGLIPPLRIKVEVGELANYVYAERRAAQKVRKMMCLEEEESSSSQRESFLPVSTRTRVLPEVTAADVIEKLNESINNMSIHFAQGVGPRNPQPPQRAPERDANLVRF